MSENRENGREDASPILPSGRTLLRAMVSVVPYVGGVLDHLLFDRADNIRLRNIESAFRAVEERLGHVEEARIDKNWFGGEEALAMFRALADKVQFEPDPKKRKALSGITAVSGTGAFSPDKHKLSVFDHISRLSYVQIMLLGILAGMKPEARTLSGGGLTQTVSALWLERIVETIRNNPDGQFWHGTMQLGFELEILTSLGMIRVIPLMVSSETAYVVTVLGKAAGAYCRAATGPSGSPG